MNSLPKPITKSELIEAIKSHASLTSANPLEDLSFQDLLQQIDSPLVLDKILEASFKKKESRVIEHDGGLEILHRDCELLNIDVACKSLKVYVSVKIHHIDIPDPAKDELTLHLTLITGCPLPQIEKFLINNKIFSTAECKSMIQDWKNSSLLIGRSEEERNLLNNLLGVYLSSCVSSQTFSLRYNIGFESNFLWRISDELLTISVPFTLDQFPFDSTEVNLILFSSARDSLFILLPDNTCQERGATALNMRNLIPPRGFDIPKMTGTLEPLIYSVDVDFIPDSIVRVGFLLRRLPGTVLWRVLVPTSMVLVLAYGATLAAIFSGIFSEAVATSILPSTLIALAALQFTANNFTPAQSGRTVLDTLFVNTYLILLTLFAAVTFPKIGITALIVSSIFFIVPAFITAKAWWHWHN